MSSLFASGVKMIGLTAILAMSITSFMTAVTPTVVVEAQLQRLSGTSNGVPIVSQVIRTEFGSTYIIGEIRNDLANVVELVEIVGRFYDSNGRLIDTGTASAELSQLRPGEKSPFRLSVTDDESVAQRITNYNLTVGWDVVLGEAKPAALRIEEGEQRINGTGGAYNIVGEIVNTGSQDTTSNKIIATFYDETGNIVDFDFTYLISAIPAGQSEVFELSGTAGNSTTAVKSVNLTAQSNEYLMIDPELEQGMQPLQLFQEHNQTTFQSIEDGLRIGIPDRWVAGEANNTDIGLRPEEETGISVITTVCAEIRAVPVMDGKYHCGTSFSLGNIYIIRFNDIGNRTESGGNQSVAISDFLEFYQEFLRNEGSFRVRDIQIVNNTDTTVNVTNVQTNQSVTTVPAMLATHNLTTEEGSNLHLFSMLVLNGNNTGYSISNFNLPSLRESYQPIRPVQTVFDSFELLQPSNSSGTATTS